MFVTFENVKKDYSEIKGLLNLWLFFLLNFLLFSEVKVKCIKYKM